MSTTPRTLSERDETYVGDIVRDENWLVNSSCTLSIPPNTITFHSEHKEVLRITADGRLVIGEGLSADEATQEAAKLLIASFEAEIQKMVEKRIAAERERVRVLREDAERNAARAEKAEAKLARLRAQNDQFSDNLSAVGKAYNAEKDRAEKAEADTARMDWLEKESLEDWGIRSIDRAAIDVALAAAMKEANK